MEIRSEHRYRFPAPPDAVYDLVMDPSRLDEWVTVHEELLHAPNGVLDWRTGTLRPGDPADRITRSLGVPFDPEAEAPRWANFHPRRRRSGRPASR